MEMSVCDIHSDSPWPPSGMQVATEGPFLTLGRANSSHSLSGTISSTSVAEACMTSLPFGWPPSPHFLSQSLIWPTLTAGMGRLTALPGPLPAETRAYTLLPRDWCTPGPGPGASSLSEHAPLSTCQPAGLPPSWASSGASLPGAHCPCPHLCEGPVACSCGPGHRPPNSLCCSGCSTPIRALSGPRAPQGTWG